MSSFHRALDAVWRRAHLDPELSDEAYLAASSDLRDLERRLAALRTSRHHLYAVGSFGILMG